MRFFFPRWPYFQQVLEPCSDRLPCCLVRVCSNRQAGSGGNANEEARGTFRPAVLTIGQRMKFATRLGSVRAALAAAFAVSFALVDAAQARLLSWPQFGSWWGVHSSPRHGHRRQPKPASTTTDQAAEIPDGPLQIIISIPDQRISVYDNDALIARSSVSTGVRGHPTPLGVFSVIARRFPPFRIVTVPCSRHVFRPLRRDETGCDRETGRRSLPPQEARAAARALARDRPVQICSACRYRDEWHCPLAASCPDRAAWLAVVWREEVMNRACSIAAWAVATLI